MTQPCNAVFMFECDECEKPCIFECTLDSGHSGDHQFKTDGQFDGYPFTITFKNDMIDFLDADDLEEKPEPIL